MKISPLHHVQRGQTLIETMVAVFVLTMGIVAALGLANFAVSTSRNIVKQITGMGLAREGVEAIKNMRDTNWLKGTLVDTCYNFVTLGTDGSCYTTWLTTPFAINAPGQRFVTLQFDPNSPNF